MYTPSSFGPHAVVIPITETLRSARCKNQPKTSRRNLIWPSARAWQADTPSGATCFDSMQLGTDRLKHILHKHADSAIATLGPKGTSSEQAVHALASQIKGKPSCLLFATYEEAAQAVISQRADYLVVANAYHSINRFYISDHLVVAGVFPQATPPYGVAVRPGTHLDQSQITLASHPAPAHLINRWFDPEHFQVEVQPAHSTSAAALAVANGETDACITTDLAREQNGLVFITDTIRIHMIWSIFVRRGHPAAHCLFEDAHDE